MMIVWCWSQDPGGKRLKAERVAVDAMGFGVESGSFRDGAEIPRRHGYKNGNVSPSLVISGAPPATKSLALIMDDPDAMGPAGKVWVHWLLWDVDPAVREISEGTVPEGAAQGTTDFGEIGYGGPAPPDKRHTYIFKVYALDTMSPVRAGATKAELEKAIKGHVLAEARLTGTYAP